MAHQVDITLALRTLLPVYTSGRDTVARAGPHSSAYLLSMPISATKQKTMLHVHESCCKCNGGGRILLLLLLRRVAQRSRISGLPQRRNRVSCPRSRRHTAAAHEASPSNHGRPAQAFPTPQVVFCASPSAASAAAPRLRCRGMFSVWASAPHAPLRGVRVPATDQDVVELG